MTKRIAQLTGMQKFTLIWFGQMLSQFGTATTRFSLMIWAYQQTGQATPLALLGFFSYILFILVSPVAGVLVDRLDRRLVMILGDFGAALMTLFLLILYMGGGLQIWHLYVAEALTGAFEAFQMPAYSASISTLVPKKQYARVSGMRSFAEAAAQVIAPALAARLLSAFGLNVVMMIDLISFSLAVLPLLFISLPRVAQNVTENAPRKHILSDLATGFRYIKERQGLLGMMLIYFGINLTASLTYFAILAPMVLARTGGDEIALGNVQAALGVGGIIGGVLMSVWGGPKRRVHGIYLIGAFSFLAGDFLMAVGRTPEVWMFAILFATIFVPIIVGSKQTIWQSKVPPELQGRVFAARGAVEMLAMPIGYLAAGPLADKLLEPAMQSGGALAGIFGGLLGTGPGAGMAFMFLCTSIAGTVICLSGYLFPKVRNIEKDLPDHTLDGLPTAT
ncbi:MAG: MFS transporter [Chloroflexi bacterium]|nr:MFS transporter [Chloroflexota bacterium]MCC6893342.1 MFS transporter [Anaerolineae bacterium]